MSDDLRTRIAAVLFDALNDPSQDWNGHLDIDLLADAVIRELQLGKEKGCGCLPEGSGCVCSYRYVSTWAPCGESDDE